MFFSAYGIRASLWLPDCVDHIIYFIRWVAEIAMIIVVAWDSLKAYTPRKILIPFMILELIESQLIASILISYWPWHCLHHAWTLDSEWTYTTQCALYWLVHVMLCQIQSLHCQYHISLMFHQEASTIGSTSDHSKCIKKQGLWKQLQLQCFMWSLCHIILSSPWIIYQSAYPGGYKYWKPCCSWRGCNGKPEWHSILG